MQITITDALVKQLFTQHIEDNMDNPDPAIIDFVFANAAIQRKLAAALSKRFEQEADVILDTIRDLDVLA